MAPSIDPSLIPSSTEQRWVDHIRKTVDLEQHFHGINIDAECTPLSIFEVPETLTTKNPTAYSPQLIGLGPIHHFRPQLYKKEPQKLAVVQKLLRDHSIQVQDVVGKVREIVHVVRACYDMCLGADDDSLVWVFAIDGLFLLHLLGTFAKKNSRPIPESQNVVVIIESQFPSGGRETVKDIMMAENQIPLMVLVEIMKAFGYSGTDFFHPSYHLTSAFHKFLENHSPLRPCSKFSPPSSLHFLDYMYRSIVNNLETPPRSNARKLKRKQKIDDWGFDGEGVDSSQLPPPGASLPKPGFLKFLEFLKEFPASEIVQLYEKILSVLERFSLSKKPAIASAFKLHDIAGVSFNSLPSYEGIRKIWFDKENKTFYLPRIALDIDSEVILRNLVAYEMLMDRDGTTGLRPDLREYLELMCGIITNAKDAKLLRERNIIFKRKDYGLDDDGVAKLFNGMMMDGSLLTTGTNRKHEKKLQKTIDEVNDIYESKLRVKMELVVKKLGYYLWVVLVWIGKFVGASWKVVAFIVSIVTVVFLIWQAFCDVYTCDKPQITLFQY